MGNIDGGLVDDIIADDYACDVEDYEVPCAICTFIASVLRRTMHHYLCRGSYSVGCRLIGWQ
jgi:hypothetical protein